MNGENTFTSIESDNHLWILNLLLLIILYNAIGYLVLLFYHKEYSCYDFIILSLISLFFSFYTYFTHINKIEIKDDYIHFYFTGRIKVIALNNFKLIEKEKVTRTLTKYKMLIIFNDKNIKVHIDSRDFKEYRLLKDYLSKIRS